jgi:hypothetical protein
MGYAFSRDLLAHRPMRTKPLAAAHNAVTIQIKAEMTSGMTAEMTAEMTAATMHRRC